MNNPDTYFWDTTLADAVREFGEAPSDELERELLRRFQREPKLVTNAIKSVLLGFNDKTIRKPWALVDIQTKNAISKIGPKSAPDERTRSVERAQQWTRSVGWQFPWLDYEDELFGRRGKLSRYRGDTALRNAMRELWESRQPAEEPTAAPTAETAA